MRARASPTARILRKAALALFLSLACAGAPGAPDPPSDSQLRNRIELRVSSDHRLCAFARAAGAERVVDRLELSLSSGDPGRC